MDDNFHTAPLSLQRLEVRRMNEKKKEVKLCGCLIRPAVVGKTAIYATRGHVYRTSRVVAIHDQTENMVHFETKNAHYYLSTSPFPPAAINPLPMRLAACA